MNDYRHRKAHIEGKVIVSYVIGTDGRLHDPKIEKGLSADLDKRALDALTFYRLQPAYDGDQSVAVRVPFQIAFQLN